MLKFKEFLSETTYVQLLQQRIQRLMLKKPHTGQQQGYIQYLRQRLAQLQQKDISDDQKAHV